MSNPIKNQRRYLRWVLAVELISRGIKAVCFRHLRRLLASGWFPFGGYWGFNKSLTGLDQDSLDFRIDRIKCLIFLVSAVLTLFIL